MIEMNVLTVIGLIGVTLVIAVGKIFDPAREWLKGFAHPLNPLRWLGEGMSCTMCSGWWVGFWWGIYTGAALGTSLVMGGVVSVLAYVTDEALAIVAAVSLRLVRKPVPVPVAQAPLRRPRVPDMEKPLTEAEAHEILDSETEEADSRQP